MKKTVCILLLAVLLLGLFGVPAVADAQEDETEKTIAIVFDNSGSMYMGGDVAWCRATYAMEVFASMMGDRDRMLIYPMNPITIGKNGSARYHYSSQPLVINGPDDASQIRMIDTLNASGTPIETIKAAYMGLTEEKNRDPEREVWLVILTDGTYFHYGDTALTQEKTKEQLEEDLGSFIDDVNIMYLGIGDNAVIPDVSVPDKTPRPVYYADKARTSDEILSKLTDMSNAIFGRDAMDVSSGVVDISDLSMRQMIFFVQGKEISNVQVTDQNGDPIGEKISERDMKYSTLGAEAINSGNTPKSNNVDYNLQGMMVTYKDCKRGTYTITYDSYSNQKASSVVAYYKPNVDLRVILTDSTGNDLMKDGSDVREGEHFLEFGLIDNETGEWAESSLLGNTQYDITYTINGREYPVHSDSKKDKIRLETLKGEDVLDATIEARYLSRYRIIKTGRELGWPDGGFRFKSNSIDASKLRIELTGGKESYKISELEKEGHYFLSASFDKKPLTGDLLKSYQPIVSMTGGNAEYTVSPASDGSGYDIFLKYHGDALHTDTGKYVLTCNVEYTDENGLTCSAKSDETKKFKIEGEEHSLGVKIQVQQGYLQVSKIDEAKPLIVHFTKDGAALMDDQLRALKIDIETDLKYDAAIMNGESAMSIRILKTDKMEKGIHRVKVHAVGTDDIGQQIEGSDSALIEVRLLPPWIRWLIGGLIALALLALILLILNQKVLPKKVLKKGDTEFTIGGHTISGTATVRYERGGKTLTLTPPDAPGFSYVNCSAKLVLQAVSPRRIPSAKRHIAVVSVVASPEISSVDVGAATYEYDNTTKQFVKDGGNAPTIISNNSTISITGRAVTNRGSKRVANLTQQLRFK